MRQTSIEIPPHKHTFRVFNKASKEFSKEFEELFEAIEYVLIKYSNRRPTYWWTENKFSFVLNNEPPISRWGFMRKDTPILAPLDVIINDLGDIITCDEIREAFSNVRYYKKSVSRRKYDDDLKKRLLRIKGSPNKIKQSCEHVRWYWKDEVSYSNRILGNYSHPGTFKEKKQTEGHIDEYGTEMVRGSRRPRQLRDSWDDDEISIWRVQHSWKHHSKRHKQWIPK